MLTITLSTYTEAGTRLHAVLQDGLPLVQPTPDGRFAAEYARQAYHVHRGPKRLVRWDGDDGTESEIEAR